MMTPRLEQLLRESREVTLVGYYGVNNFGDDLMLRSILDKLEPLHLKLNLVSYGEAIPWISPAITVYRWSRGRRFRNIRMFLQAVSSSSLVLWGGGTCFTDEDGDGLFRPMMLALLSGKPIAYVGVGIGNLTSWSRRARTVALLNASCYVSFRDERSYRQGRSWTLFHKDKVERIDDPAHELLRTYSPPVGDPPRKSRTLVLAWRNLEKYGATTLGNRLTPVVDLCLRLARQHGIERIEILNADSSYDEKCGRKLYDLLAGYAHRMEVTYCTARYFEDKLKILAAAEVVVTSRLHVGAAAYFLNITCYMYNYSPKIAIFMGEFGAEAMMMLEDKGDGELQVSAPQGDNSHKRGTEHTHG
ncbi:MULTISPECIES: polysaccharide pyruvyl transferase family protein [Paenibacillus]|uniref:polysaccharide pyruvyl transferase family protein n=1 Tax=Paenibacillus TaxID=44249 RepID=UPI0022B8CDBD|nr:polysaccharide pyruvyl transferase family protein [Paenibacillus caseinilyticus]MCZ8519304.1 polysaccharide pyruvyl transferase family protein [Paenibacillus caseinilyticus]